MKHFCDYRLQCCWYFTSPSFTHCMLMELCVLYLCTVLLPVYSQLQ